MPVVTVEHVSKPIRDLFNKGFTALERGNTDYAIDLLTRCVLEEPGLERAWRFLRAAEIKRFKMKSGSQLGNALSEGLRLPIVMRAGGQLKSGKFKDAMFSAEKLLHADPLNPKYVKLFCEAAIAAEFPEVAQTTFELLREHKPDDPEVLDLCGTLYTAIGYSRGARECFEELSVLRPNDGEALKKLKDAMALDSMSSGGWTEAAAKKGSFHEMLRNQDEAVQLERQSKSVKSEQDIESLIEEAEKKIEQEPGNVNLYRALAGHYADAKQYDKASDTLARAVAMNPGDGELDKALSNMRLKGFDQQIEMAKAAGDEAMLADAEYARMRFEFEDLQNRVERYPNDLDLRYDWGMMLFKHEYVNEAIQQFQAAQRNPKLRVRALLQLGLCFKAKGQNDLAVDQLQHALEDLPVMDATKKTVLYELGELCALLGKSEESSEYFKKIYQVDIGFRDVAEKVEHGYR